MNSLDWQSSSREREKKHCLPNIVNHPNWNRATNIFGWKNHAFWLKTGKAITFFSRSTDSDNFDFEGKALLWKCQKLLLLDLRCHCLIETINRFRHSDFSIYRWCFEKWCFRDDEFVSSLPFFSISVKNYWLKEGSLWSIWQSKGKNQTVNCWNRFSVICGSCCWMDRCLTHIECNIG